jgi:glycosyltransferase involved in cell wall biosynthesis
MYVLTSSELSCDINSPIFQLETNYPGPYSPALWSSLFLNPPDFDIIFVSTFPYDHCLPAYAASKKWNIPIIFLPLIHQEFPELFLNSVKLTMLNNSNAIVVLTKSEKNILTKYEIDSHKIHVIRPGVPDYPKKMGDNLILELKKLIPKNFKIIFFLGTKSRFKGIFNLIESMKLIWKTYSNVILILGGSSTPEFEKYISHIPNFIQEKIIDLGILNDDEKHQILELCDIFVMPSKSESFGLVYLEAWIHAKPVIACNIAAISELIEHNVDGLLVEYDNPTQLSVAIKNLLDSNSLRKTLGKNGEKKATSFKLSESCKNFEKLCQNICDLS